PSPYPPLCAVQSLILQSFHLRSLHAALPIFKEVLPQQLAPSGVLGLIGFTQTGGEKVIRASSWSRFIDVFGAASAYSLPEARQADRKSTRLNSSHEWISYAVFCLKKKKPTMK